MQSVNKYEKFLIESSLYDKLEIKSDEVDEIKSFLSGDISITIYCKSCKNISVFKCKKNKLKESKKSNYTSIIDVEGGHSFYEDIFQRELNDLIENNKYITLDYKCSKNEEHEYRYDILLEHDYIMKIGQYPSYADIEKVEIKKYKQILGDKYDEYNRAVSLFSCNVGIGSFVYIRRIIEKFVIDAYKEALNNDKISEEEFTYKTNEDGVKRHTYFKEKIDILKEYIPAVLVENKCIYTILSKGIHELSEEECLEYFTVVKATIDSILSDLLNKKEKLKSDNEIKKELNKINAKLKK